MRRVTVDLVVLTCFIGPATAAAQATRPVAVAPAQKGPAIDPAKLAAAPYTGVHLFGTFRSFVEASYAVANVWVSAAGGPADLLDANVGYDYPDFYKPTWGEVFDHVARQVKCRWSFDPATRQFDFEPSDAGPAYDVTLAAGWRREDRGRYVWHAPADQEFGLDVYDYGHFTADPARPDLFKRVRESFAVRETRGWPDAPKLSDMTPAKVAGADALYLRRDTPRPGGLWRQWAVVTDDGHAFVIVSAMPKDREAALGPAVDQMVASFANRRPATGPATAPVAP